MSTLLTVLHISPTLETFMMECPNVLNVTPMTRFKEEASPLWHVSRKKRHSYDTFKKKRHSYDTIQGKGVTPMTRLKKKRHSYDTSQGKGVTPIILFKEKLSLLWHVSRKKCHSYDTFQDNPFELLCLKSNTFLCYRIR